MTGLALSLTLVCCLVYAARQNQSLVDAHTEALQKVIEEYDRKVIRVDVMSQRRVIFAAFVLGPFMGRVTASAFLFSTAGTSTVVVVELSYRKCTTIR